MKIALIFGVVLICVLGFLLFLWKISKEQTEKPIEQVKEAEKKEVDFIKQRQALYQKDKDVQKVSLLSSENRGALFERAIERKKNEYRDDDQEYQKRLIQQKNEIQPEVEPEPFVPVKHPISVFKKVENIENHQEDNHTETTMQPFENKQVEISEPVKEKNDRIVRNNLSLQERKEQIATYEREKELSIDKFRDEILLEIENIRKRRKALMDENT